MVEQASTLPARGSPAPRLRGLGRATVAAALAALVLLTPTVSRATGDPRLDWWTIETAHASIHYARGLEPIAEQIARAVENLHQSVAPEVGHPLASHTEIVLTDDTDSANGLATAVPYNTVRLYVTGPGDLTALSDYDDWYVNLLSHEYTHIMHTDAISGVPAVINAVLGKTYAPNQIQPRWILEGLAILGETRTSTTGRLRASLWDTYLRTDFLEDNVARLDQISSSPRRWPNGTIWYLYGSYFMQWIAEIYGRDALRAMVVDYGASLLPWGINRAIRRVTGRTYVELYEAFVAQQRQRYERQLQAVAARGLREGKRLTFHGRALSYPQFVPAEARRGAGPHELLYYREDGSSRTGLYSLELGAEPDHGRLPETLVARTTNEGPVAFGPDGTLYFSSVAPWQQVYSRSDLFSLARGERATEGTEPERRRLTEGLRATAPTVSPSGRLLAFTANHAGTTTLQLAPIEPTGELGKARTLVAGEQFGQIYTPAYSPDGRRIAYSAWTERGVRDIWLVDVGSARAERVTHDRALDLQPCWSPDGRRLYFASDRTGIYNIYEYSLEGGELRQVTNVRTAAVMPTVSEDGRLLAYVGYTSAGYDLYLMAIDRDRMLPALPPTEPPPAPGDFEVRPPVAMERHPYSPWPTVAPKRWFFSYAPGSFDANALTLTVDAGDVVGQHSLSGSLLVDPAAELPQLSLTYTYGRLPVDFSVMLFNRLNPRTDYEFNDQNPQVVEQSYGVRTSLSYDVLTEFVRHNFGLSYTFSYLDASLPVATLGPISPYSAPMQEPFQGVMGVVHAGYGLSMLEGSFKAAGGVRSGVALNLAFDLADEATASTESLYAASYRLRGYVPMPWRGDHVLAIASSGGMSTGTYSRRSLYYVGGYDLENNTLLDTITSGVFNGAFPLRGYPANSYKGSVFLLENFEYRFPIAEPDRGISMVPVYLRRVDGNLFLDFGGAFEELDYESIDLLSHAALVSSPQLHTAVGAEIWLGATIAYALDLQLRLGYAFGFSAAALPGGQGYFVAASAY